MKKEMRIYPDYVTLCQEAAQLVKSLIQKSIQERNICLLVLSGGSTPRGLYRYFSSENYSKTIPWGKVHIFWGDERCVLPEDPESNYGQAKRDFIDQIEIPAQNIHRIPVELGSHQAALRYQNELHKFASGSSDMPIFDLVLLGLGEDGHAASIFPGSVVDVSQSVQVVAAHYQDRPVERITLTPLSLNNARNILFLVSGESKAKAVASSLEGSFDPVQKPSQRINPPEGHIFWLLDEPSSQLLSLKKEAV